MATEKDTQSELGAIRDAVESIWVAIVLAFVLRAFMVEAFVIPTGSMAPRLMGEHLMLRCASCKYEFAFGASREPGLPACDVCKYPQVRCPSCNYVTAYGLDVDESKGIPCSSPGCRRLRGQRRHDMVGRVRSGDRVLVLKYLYRFAEPKPFDVVVFKNPQNNTENYIKRLIGLPGETIEIVHGNVFVGESKDGPWTIRRKPPRAQKAMWQIVFDNDYRPDESLREQFGNWSSPVWKRAGASDVAWQAEPDSRRNAHVLATRQFRFIGAEAMQEIMLATQRDDFMPRYGYNASNTIGQPSIDENRDVCTDVKLSVVYEPIDKTSTVALMLSSFEHRFKGEVRADGKVRLFHRTMKAGGEQWTLWGEGQGDGVAVGKACEIALTHADYRVTLWVDGQAVLASSDTQYTPDHDALTNRMAAAVGDVVDKDLGSASSVPTPQVRIGAAGGPCKLSHVRVMRDVYYTALPLQENSSEKCGPMDEYFQVWKEARARADLPDSGIGWGVMGRPITLARNRENPDLDEFFVLGDNSPQSLDSRAWTTASPSLRLYADAARTIPQYKLGTVPRYNMIGKAFFVYWPAGFSVPGLPELPVIPNFGRMRLIR